MPANECIPTKDPAATLTVKAGSTITGKRFVKISAVRTGGGLNAIGTDTQNVPVAAPCSVAGEAALGVAKYDIASGSLGGVYKLASGVIVPIKAGANITAGQEVQTDASGQAIPYAPPTTTNAAALPTVRVLGYAIDSASSGADAEIALY